MTAITRPPLAPSRPAPGEPPAGPAPGARWFALVWLVALIVLAANHPGRMVFDTKLGVDIAPADFYARLWHLWNPLEWLGTLQNQYIGYAFPMAPFYLAAHAAGLPVWLTERLWMSLLIAVGFLGAARLAGALGIGSPRSRLLAGLAFALWPTFTILVGSTSASILPGLLAPWAVLPLVTVVRGGPASRGRLARAAARSGVAVLSMGGVNAVVTLEALILPGLFILVCARGRQRAGLAACWALAVALATSWWAGPLLLQGRYSFNFLPYIEQAGTTTRTMSAAATLLGAGNWTAYFDPGTPWLSAGWTIVSAPAAIGASVLAAAAGLAGVARRDLPWAAWLRLSAGVAAAGALAGYYGPLGGPFHGPADRLLDGALAPLRNVYKFESVLALVLALGIAHLLARCLPLASGAPGGAAFPRRSFLAPQSRRRRAPSARWAPQSRRRRAPSARSWRPGLATRPAVVVVLAGLVIAGLALPYLSDQVLNPGSFRQVPRYWYQAADFLAAHSPREPAFVVPADSHGLYQWGDPIDDPLEPLARSPWVERGLVPFGGAGSQSFLDTAETAVESGEDVPGLAAYLGRAGVRYIVVRNDLSPQMAGYTLPAVVHATLAQSGFRRVAGFGPLVANELAASVADQLPGARTAYRAVEIYAAASPAAAGPAQVLPASQTVLVDGGPDSILQLAGQGILGGRPAIVAGDRQVTAPSLWAVTDGQRRADHAFGLITGNVSATYTATQVNPPDDQLGGAGGPPRQLLPVPQREQTVAELSGAAAVTASSVGSWLTEAPQDDPVNAFDGSPATAWAVGVPGRAAGQWIQVRFGPPRTLTARAGIRLLAGSPSRPVISRVAVTTAAGRVVTELRPTSAAQPLRIPPGPTRWLRVTITGTRRAAAGSPGAGIADVLIPGVRVTSFLRPAQDDAGQRAASQAFSFQQQLPSPALLGRAAAYPPLARTFATSGRTQFRLTATAVALPGRALTAILSRLVPAGRDSIAVSATSTLGSLPSLAPAGLLRGAHASPWIAASPHPVLRLSWAGRRRISELVLTPDAGVGAAPRMVRVASPAGVREAEVGFGGLVTLARPLVTDQLSISFPASQPSSAAGSVAARPGRLPIALSRLSIPGLAGLRPASPTASAAFRLPCGQGPAVTIDGRRLATAVTGQVGALLGFRPVQVRLCPRSTLDLAAGRHWLTAAPAAPFAITGLSLTTGPIAGPAASSSAAGSAPAVRPAVVRPATADTGTRSLRVLSWQAESRSVRVGPGAQSYLEVHQNANSGWVATLDGRRLTPVRLDGWQQGYVLPAGRGGRVMLSFAPAGPYHVLLLGAGLGVLLLLALALPRRRPNARRGPAPATSTEPEPKPEPEPATAASSAAGRPLPAAPDQPPAFTPPAGTPAEFTPPAGTPAAFTPPAHPTRRPPPATLAATIAVTGLVAVVGGPVAAAVPVLAALAWWWPQSRPVVAAAAIGAAGVITVTAARPGAFGSGAFSAAAQACALIALAAALLPASWPDRRPAGQEDDR